jgi:histidinol-phosphate aminotransferase
LREKGILVRHFTDPLISEYVRITIGTENEMAEITKQLRELIEINGQG